MSVERKSATAGGPTASPCVSVCVMDAASGLCTGCLRTLDEIAAWSVLGDDERRAVLAALPARRQRVAVVSDGRC